MSSKSQNFLMNLAHLTLIKTLGLTTCVKTLFELTLEMHAVHALQVEIGELKGRLTEVISNCDALCKRIATEGPQSLRSSVKPFAVSTADSDIIRKPASQQDLRRPPLTENKPD